MILRIEGTEREIEAVLHELPSILEIRRVTPFRLVEGAARVGRRFVTVVPPTPDDDVT